MLLSSVISQNNRDSLNWLYTQQMVNYPDEPWQEDQVVDEVQNNEGGGSYTAGYIDHFNNGTLSTSVGELDVNTILFKNGKVLFDLDPLTRQDQPNNKSCFGLQAIRVMAYNFSSHTYQLQKKIAFFKSYFAPSRLRLDSIQIQDASGLVVQHYRFSYNTAVSMPAYSTMAKDYWGYYNGKTNSTSLIPHFVFSASNTSGNSTYNIGASNPVANNRGSDSTFMQAGVLTSIAYPTGGHTDFAYQSNQYIDGNGNLAVVGGLRIASIKSYLPGNTVPLIKTYRYNTARANYNMDFSYYIASSMHAYWSSGNSGVTIGAAATARFSAIMSYPNSDPAPFDQALVVYPSVSEFTGTPTANIGRTDFLFRDYPDSRETTQNGLPNIIQTNFYRRGQVLTKKDYLAKTDGSYQLVKKDSSSYTAFPQNGHEIAGWVMGEQYWPEGPGAPAIQHYGGGGGNFNPNQTNGFVTQLYSIPSDDNYLIGTTTYVYDQLNPTLFTTNTVLDKYDNILHQQISRSYHTDSKGNTAVSVMKYPADYLATGSSSTGSALLDTMLLRNMQATQVEKWDSLKTASTGLTAVTASQLNLYKVSINTNIAVVPDKVKKLSLAAPITNFVPAYVSSGNMVADSRYSQLISFDSYDQNGNITQYTPRNATSVAILWDYNGSLPIAQVKNSLYTSAAYTSFETGNKGGWTYAGAPVVDATAPTGNMVYPLAAGSITYSVPGNTPGYTLAYWSNNGIATVVNGSNAAIPGKSQRASQGWTYFEHPIPGNAGGITISGAVSIDELKLYPANAQMTTYSYLPSGLQNLTGTHSETSSFDYDFFQRLQDQKDLNGNLTGYYNYHNYDMSVPNDAINTPVLYRNNCPSNANPTSTTYTVAAGSYYSNTKVSANAAAQYAHDTYGQTYANKVCGCPVPMITVTLANYTNQIGFLAIFSGSNNTTYQFPTSGTSTIQVPAGTYNISLQPGAMQQPYNWTLGNRNPVTATSTTFSNVVISASSTDTSLTVDNASSSNAPLN